MAGKGQSKPRVSLCMIVKDEEENLPRCLESVKNVVDEIVIVDTGSQDRTPEVAKSYGARVFFHPWQNDFSLHRNQSISYATGDWILIMDADEELDALSARRFRKTLASIPKGTKSLRFTVVDKSRSGELRMAMKSVRMFTNDGTFHYEGFVHNQLVGDGPTADVDLTIYHYGYDLDEAGLEKKFQRTAGLLHKQLEEEPDNLFTLFNLVNIYNMCRRPAGATEYGERLIELLEKKKKFPPVYINAFYATAAAYLNIRNFKRAKEIALKALSMDPKYVDALWILTYASFMEKDFPGAIKWGERFLETLSYYNQQMRVGFKDHLLYKAYLVYSIGKQVHALLFMALAALKLGDKSRARRYFDAVVSADRSEKTYAKVMHHLVASDAKGEVDVEIIDHYVNKALKDFPQDEGFWHIKMAVEDARGNLKGVIDCLKKLAAISGKELWRAKLAEYYLAHKEPRKAIALLQELWLERKIPAYACNLGVAYHQLGDLKKAENWYREALAEDPFHEETLFNLGQMLFETGNLDEAQKMFEKLIEIEPNNEEALLFASLISAQKGNLEDCLRWLDKSLEAQDFKAHVELNSLEELAAFLVGLKRNYQDQGKKGCARLVLEIAREVYPDPVFIEDLIQNGRRVSVERVLNLIQRGINLGIQYQPEFLSQIETWAKNKVACGTH